MSSRKLDIGKSKLKKIKSLQKQVTSAYGGGHLTMGNDVDGVVRIPTGSMPMDIITGGGYPIGGTYLFWGWEGCGKTASCLLAAAQAQRICSKCDTFINPVFLTPPEDEDKIDKWRTKRHQCVHCGSPYHDDQRPLVKAKEIYGKNTPDGVSKNDIICDECLEVGSIEKMSEDTEYPRMDGGLSCECGACEPRVVLFIDFEGRYNKEWAEKLGVNSSALILEQPEYGEAGIDVASTAITEGAVDVLIIDSIAQIATTEELAKSAEEGTMTTGARLVNKFLRSLPSRVAQAKNNHNVKVTTFIVNQVREKIGVSFGNPDTMYGGHGQKFLSSCTLKFTSSKADVDEIAVGAKSRKEFIGATDSTEIRVQCEKNSHASTEGLKTTFNLVTSEAQDGILKKGEVNDYDIIYKYGRKTGVIENGTKWTVEGWPIEYQNAGDLKVDMHHRPHFRNHLRKEISDKIRESWREVRKML